MTNTSAHAPVGRVAGIDYGTVRIGIAISDARRTLASPLENYTRRSQQLDGAHLARLAKEEQVSLFVVGLPVRIDGQESKKSLEVRRFGQWLQETTGAPVEYFDERYTSREAQQLLGAANLSKQRRKERLDKLAAQILLTAYLESAGGVSAPGSLDD
ncbi:MAG TPA: Holliday junction resolvase RuvX [Pirellulales bacterium]|jgi:putative Holliday junction resolvase